MNRTVTSTVSAIPVLILAILVAAGLGACSRQESLAYLEDNAGAVSIPAPTTDSFAEREAIRQSLRDFTAGVRGADGAADLRIVQVGIDSDYALTTWLRGENGGQAVLRKEEGTWKVVDRRPGWYGLKGLRQVKVPAEVAKRLLDELDPNWVSYEARL